MWCLRMGGLRTQLCVLVFSSVVAGMLAPDAEAQRKRPGRTTYQPITLEATAVALDQVPVVQVSPSQTKVVVMAPGAGDASPARPLSKQEKVRALTGGSSPGGAAGVGTTPEPKLTSITLSARRPFLNNRGYLEFNEVRHFDADKNQVSWYQPSPGMGYVTGRLNLVKGKRYLADMNVSCYESQTFAFAGQQISVKAGNHHLLIILEPTQSGWVNVTLSNDKSYTFHSLEVTLQE